MKKIFNWTFGSIFRTFGRIIAYLSVGLLIFSILSKSGFKLTDILPIMRVNAETFDAINVDNFAGNNMCVTDSYTGQGCATASRNIPFFYSYEIVSDNFSRLFYFDSNQKEYVLPTGASYTIIPVYIKSNEDFKFVSDYSSSNQQITSNMIDFNLSIWNSTNNGSKWFTCDLLQHDDDSNYYYYRCPVQGNIHAIRTSVNFIYANTNLVQTVPTIKVGIGELWSLALDNAASIESALNESKQNTEDIKNSTNDIKDSINNDNVDDSTNTASNFFNNFSTDTHGLTGIITAPLNAIQSLTSKTCSPLVLPLPFVDKDLTLPCMREIYVDNFGAFMNIYDIITLGIISYWVMVRIFALVKDFKNPDHDEIEVMDL